MTDPIDAIVWKRADELRANAWNPNRVFKAELALLEHSLLTTGWIQPILVNRHDLIIDGFHRWSLATSSAPVRDRWLGMVPCAVLDIPDDEAMAVTVRINRAKGTHMAVHLHELVTALVRDYDWSVARVARDIGATRAEVELLLRENVFDEVRVKEWAYSKAWYPADGPYGGAKGEAWDRKQRGLEP